MGTGLLAIGGAALAPIAAGFADLMSYAGQLRNLSARTGESVENLSRLGYAAGVAGIGLDELGGMSKHLDKHLDEAVEKGGEAAAAFDRLGLSAQQLKGMGLEGKILAIADQFAKLTNQTERDALAQKLFSKSGDEVLPFLRKGAAGIRELMQEGEDLGAVLTTTDAAALKEFGLSLEQLKNSGRFAFMALGKALIPALGDMKQLNKDIVTVVKSVRTWIQENGRLVILVFKVSAGVVAVGTGLVILGTVLSSVGTVLTAVVGLVTGLVGVLLSPLGIILMIAGAVARLWSQTEAGKGFMSRVAGDWKASWGAILAAVQSGDLEGAFEVVLANMKVMWLDLAESVEQSWLSIFGEGGSGQRSFAHLITFFLGGLQTAWAYLKALAEMIFHLAVSLGTGLIPGTDNLTRSFKQIRESFKKEMLGIEKDTKGVLAELDADEAAKKKGHLKGPADQARADRDALIAQQRDQRNAPKLPGLLGGGLFAAGQVKGGAPPRVLAAALAGLPALAAGTQSGYAIGQSLALSDKVNERIAEGIDGVNDKLDQIKDKIGPAKRD